MAGADGVGLYVERGPAGQDRPETTIPDEAIRSKTDIGSVLEIDNIYCPTVYGVKTTRAADRAGYGTSSVSEDRSTTWASRHAATSVDRRPGHEVPIHAVF